MKKLLNLLIIAALFIQWAGCAPEAPPIKKVGVTNITAKTKLVTVTHTKHTGSGAGGAAAGAAAGYFLGGELKDVVTGGAVGYGLSHNPQAESWTEQEEHITWTAFLSNGDSVKTNVQHAYHIGDSVCVCHYSKWCCHEH